MRRAAVLRGAVGLALLVLVPVGLSSCNSTDGYPPRREYVPEVTMPTDLNRDEEALLPEVAEVLREAGYRPTRERDAEYELSLSIEDGPVNADTRIRLRSGRREVARAYARVGGPRIVFQRRRVIRESFEKALREFEAQLPGYGDRRREVGPGDRRVDWDEDDWESNRRDRYN